MFEELWEGQSRLSIHAEGGVAGEEATRKEQRKAMVRIKCIWGFISLGEIWLKKHLELSSKDLDIYPKNWREAVEGF